MAVVVVLVDAGTTVVLVDVVAVDAGTTVVLVVVVTVGVVGPLAVTFFPPLPGPCPGAVRVGVCSGGSRRGARVRGPAAAVRVAGLSLVRAEGGGPGALPPRGIPRRTYQAIYVDVRFRMGADV